MILLIFHNAQIATNYEELVLKFVAISIWPAVWVFYHLTKVDISIENIDFNKNAAISI
jgi:hypothetical protein